MKKMITSFAITLLLSFNLFGQITFEKSFTNSDFDENNHYDEEAVGVAQTSDGNYLLTGVTYDESGNADVIVSKHDLMGNVIWEKIYGSPEYDKGYAVAEILDGGIVVAARTDKLDDDGDWWILRMDSNGDTLWTLHYGYTGKDIPYKIIPLDNGNFVVAGQMWGKYVCTLRGDDGFIVQLTPDGHEVWHHIVANSAKDPLKGITQTSDGGFVVCGNVWDEDNEIYDTYAYKIDANGEMKWTHRYRYNNSSEEYNNQRANAITELPNGELIMVGKKFVSIQRDDWNVMIKRLDSGGNVLRDTYDYQVDNAEARDVVVADDGNLILVGESSNNIFVRKYDTSGVRLSQKIITDNASEPSYGMSIVKTSDGGLLIGGTVTLDKHFPSGYYYAYKKRLLCKTDENGNFQKLFYSRQEFNFGEVEYGESKIDTLIIRNMWLHSIHLSSSLQYYSPPVFTLLEGEIENDTLAINNNESLRLIIKYEPTEANGDVLDSTFTFLSWGMVGYNMNYHREMPVYGRGKDPVGVDDETLPDKFQLSQNYPNPFNPTTTISYVIANPNRIGVKQSIGNSANAYNSLDCHASLRSARNDGTIQVLLKVYDALGREVATLVNAKQTAGKYSVKFDASELTSGIYFYTLRAGNFVQTKKMVLMK